MSSITGSASSPYIPSSDFSPLPPLRSQISLPQSAANVSSMFSRHSATTPRSLANLLGNETTLTHYTTLAGSPMFDPPVSLPTHVTGSHHVSTSGGGHVGDPLLDNSNLCDILMLERALESEAALGGGLGPLGGSLGGSLGHSGSENKVDMLEIPGKGRCYVYLAR